MSRNLMSWLVLLGLAILLVALLNHSLESPEKLSISEFQKLVDDQRITQLTIKEDGEIKGEQVPLAEAEGTGATTRFKVLYPREAIDNDFVTGLIRDLPEAEIECERPNQLMMVLLSFLPWLLIFGVIWFVFFRQIRTMGGGGGMLGSFGRSRHRVSHKEHTNVTFNDVAGIEESKEEVAEIIEFLKAPKKFQRLGGRIPRGILLVGEPGCGKTLLAKAIAGEADVPFFSISGSDFVEMFVGVGASRVYDQRGRFRGR